MPHDHSHDFDGASGVGRRALIAVIVLNGALFFVEMIAGALARSSALQADALDFGADALTYALSLAVIGDIAVMGAAVAVATLNSGWPDQVVAVGMAGLFWSSSVQILRRAGHEIAHGH